MATIYIDNRPYPANEQENLLQQCLSLGFNLPYFCWHPAMGSVGACRQCAVKQFKNADDKRGKLVMACMTPAKDGTFISIDDPDAREFRTSVAEWLMVNHPHDCPVCDEGGECHLQDMTVMNGHVYRRYRGPKRTFRNQDLGPLVNHEMNRCIQCYRCVRFYREYAGGRDLDALVLRDKVYFGRHEDGILESEFSGNLVEVCPTGVFTDKTLRWHYTRKWDLQTAPSICVHCGSGCNTIPAERYGTLRRIHNRFNGEVNGYFLCDRGRYGYEFVNSALRIRQPAIRRNKNEPPQPTAGQDALQYLSQIFSPGRAVGIGSPRASVEANFALRTLVGPDRFHTGLNERQSELLSSILNILKQGPAHIPSLRDVELADAVLVLGEDVSNTAPRLALALRQSVRRQPEKLAEKMKIPLWNDHAVREATQHEHGPLFIATVTGTRLDDIATRTFRGAPDDIARLGFAVANKLDAASPSPAELSDEARTMADAIAEKLKGAERPLVISGMGCGDAGIIKAAANVARALCNTGRPAALCYVVPECNSLGVAMQGGGTLEAALELFEGGDADVLVILENDLYRRSNTLLVDRLLRAGRHIVVIDHILNRTAEKADVLLPAAAFVEADGTLISNEGRAQRYFQVFVPEGETQASWRWVRDLLAAAGRASEANWANLDEITAASAAAIQGWAPISGAAPPASFRIDGEKIPRQPHRYSGRTAMHAGVSVHEPEQPNDPDTALAFSMEGYQDEPPPSLIPRFWSPGWNSIQALNKFQQEVGGPLIGGDPGVRLIEPATSGEPGYFENIPAEFRKVAGKWLIVPLHHVFGGEELSVLSPGIAQLAPAPYLALNPVDAAGLGLERQEDAILQLFDNAGNLLAEQLLPVKLKPELPEGMAGLPTGLPGLGVVTGAELPAWGRVTGIEKGNNGQEASP